MNNQIDIAVGVAAGRLEVASASAASVGSSEPASAKASGTEPRPPPGGRVASVHHNRRLRLVDPPGSGHLSSRFFGWGSDVSPRPLLAGSEAVCLLLDEVDNGLIAIVEGVNRVLLTPHRVAVFRAEGDAQARVQDLEFQVVAEKKILKVAPDLCQAGPDAGLEPRIRPVRGMPIFLVDHVQRR
jgi:hypothetical protein